MKILLVMTLLLLFSGHTYGFGMREAGKYAEHGKHSWPVGTHLAWSWDSGEEPIDWSTSEMPSIRSHNTVEFQDGSGEAQRGYYFPGYDNRHIRINGADRMFLSGRMGPSNVWTDFICIDQGTQPNSSARTGGSPMWEIETEQTEGTRVLALRIRDSGGGLPTRDYSIIPLASLIHIFHICDPDRQQITTNGTEALVREVASDHWQDTDVWWGIDRDWTFGDYHYNHTIPYRGYGYYWYTVMGIKSEHSAELFHEVLRINGPQL